MQVWRSRTEWSSLFQHYRPNIRVSRPRSSPLSPNLTAGDTQNAGGTVKDQEALPPPGLLFLAENPEPVSQSSVEERGGGVYWSVLQSFLCIFFFFGLECVKKGENLPGATPH